MSLELDKDNFYEGKDSLRGQIPRRRSEASLGELIKSWEYEAEGKPLRHDLPLVIRLDGRAFHTFTHGLDKPLDVSLKEAMIRTTEYLVEEFKPNTGYTQSDEITLIFMPKQIESEDDTSWVEYPFKGRKMKLASIFAGTASAVFNQEFKVMQENLLKEGKKKREKSKKLAVFDARVFNTPTESDAELVLWWRFYHDCRRNGISALAQCHFSAKQLHKKSSRDKIKMLEEKGITLTTQDPHLILGTTVKREYYMVDTINTTKEPKISIRTRVVSRQIDWGKISVDERANEARGVTMSRRDFVKALYWN